MKGCSSVVSRRSVVSRNLCERPLPGVDFGGALPGVGLGIMNLAEWGLEESRRRHGGIKEDI